MFAPLLSVTYYQQSAHAHKPASNFPDYFHDGYNYVSLLLLIVTSDWMETIAYDTGATQEGACEEEYEGCAVDAAGAGSSSESESSSASAASV
jgi:hypothetical protein